ncbi:hypothetical protein WAI453_002377 [Rhynchosporium graminicola]
MQNVCRMSTIEYGVLIPSLFPRDSLPKASDRASRENYIVWFCQSYHLTESGVAKFLGRFEIMAAGGSDNCGTTYNRRFLNGIQCYWRHVVETG